MTRSDPDALALQDAIGPHVAFDGWTPAAFAAARRDIDMDESTARAACPRGAVDLAVLFHREGDRRMKETVRTAATADMRIRDKVAFAVQTRLDTAGDKEAVRRGTTLFSLPHMAPEGATLIWGTADAIWTALGDPSDDLNWYTKRATLSGVYGSVVLYWLGDQSEGHAATRAFIDRRIEDVMRIEKAKAQIRDNRMLRPFTGPLERLAGMVRAPTRMPASGMPGSWVSPRR